MTTVLFQKVITIFKLIYNYAGADPYRFHRFTEIGQIFHNKYIFSKQLESFQVEICKVIWTVSKYLIWMTQKPREGDFGELK